MTIILRTLGSALSFALYLGLLLGLLSVFGQLLPSLGLLRSWGPPPPPVLHPRMPPEVALHWLLPAFLQGALFGAKWGALIGAIWGAASATANAIERRK